MLRLSISRPLFRAKADALTPSGTPPWPRRGYRPPRRSGRAPARTALLDHLVGAGVDMVAIVSLRSPGVRARPLLLSQWRLWPLRWRRVREHLASCRTSSRHLSALPAFH